MKKTTELIKLRVCIDCLSPSITNINCICVYRSDYKTILLEFEKCKCCDNISNEPADTKFNREQFEKLIDE